MKKLLLTLLLVCPLVVCHGQDFVLQNNFNYLRTDVGRVLPANTPITQWRLEWTVNGAIATCTASGLHAGFASINVTLKGWSGAIERRRRT